MALPTDNETLTKELKMAAKMGRNFILSLTSKPSDGFLALSKKVIPKSEDVAARKKTQKKVFRGRCFKEGNKFIFETDKKVSDQMTLKLKQLIKEQTAFKMKAIELRQKAALGAAEAEPDAEEEEEEVQASASQPGSVAAEEEEEAVQTSSAPEDEEEEVAMASEGEEEEVAMSAQSGDVNPFSGEAAGDVNPFSGEAAAAGPSADNPRKKQIDDIEKDLQALLRELDISV